MSVKKEIKEIKENLIGLRKELTPEIMAKAKLYDELMENLSNVHIKLKSAKRVITESGSKQLKIEYEIDPVILSFDDNDKPIYNPSFVKWRILYQSAPTGVTSGIRLYGLHSDRGFIFI